MRKPIVVVVVIAAIAVAVFVVLRRGSAAAGYIVGLRAFDDGALVVFEGEGKDEPTSWVTRVDLQGRERWTRRLPQMAMTGNRFGPAMVVDGAAIVRYGCDYRCTRTPPSSRAIAFDLETGQQLWDQEIAAFQKYKLGTPDALQLKGLPDGTSDIAFGKSLVSYADAGTELVVKGIEARTGRVLWQRALERGFGTGVGLVLSTSYLARSQWIDAATGAERDVYGTAIACVAGDELVYRPNTEQRVVAASLTKPVRTIFDAAGIKQLGNCGAYKNGYVLFVTTADDKNAVVIVNAAGEQVRTIALQDDGFAPFVTQPFPRFVPLVIRDRQLKTVTEPRSIIMLDLETGSIAWTSKTLEDRDSARIYLAGSNWIWRRSRNIVVFDGSTGSLAAAASSTYDKTEDVSSTTTATTLWLHGHARAAPRDAPLTALQLPSLQPRFEPRGLTIVDTTQVVRAELGIP